jgi:hypothetical protein
MKNRTRVSALLSRHFGLKGRRFGVKILVVTGSQAGTVFRLHDGVNTLGREVSNRIRLPDLKVSRRHCRIRKIGQSLFLTDLGARNGTSVNGRPVAQAELAIGDQIRIGNTILRVVGEDYFAEGSPVGSPRRIGLFGFIIELFGFLRSVEDIEKVGSAAAVVPRKRQRALWRTPVEEVPPESRRETRVTVTDPD